MSQISRYTAIEFLTILSRSYNFHRNSYILFAMRGFAPKIVFASKWLPIRVLANQDIHRNGGLNRWPWVFDWERNRISAAKIMGSRSAGSIMSWDQHCRIGVMLIFANYLICNYKIFIFVIIPLIEDQCKLFNSRHMKYDLLIPLLGKSL